MQILLLVILIVLIAIGIAIKENFRKIWPILLIVGGLILSVFLFWAVGFPAIISLVIIGLGFIAHKMVVKQEKQQEKQQYKMLIRVALLALLAVLAYWQIQLVNRYYQIIMIVALGSFIWGISAKMTNDDPKEE